jgi:HSP20 family protein
MAYFDFEPEERFRSTWGPVIDVYENPQEIIVRAELPGVRKKDIRLRWKDGILTLTGTKERQFAGQEHGRFLCVERQYGSFRRDIAINTPIDFKKSSAELRNGLLKVRLPKVSEQGRETTIPIEEN